MAQQPPLAPQAQGMPDMNKLLASMSPQQVQQAMQAASAMTGIDPKMLQAAQQQLANPNGGDQFQAPGAGPKPMNPNDIMPFGPKEMLVGAVGGIGLSKVFERLFKASDKGESPIIQMARKLDRLPLINRASSWLEVTVLPKIKGARADRALGRVSDEVASKQLAQELAPLKGSRIPQAITDRLTAQTSVEGLQNEISAILEHPLQKLHKVHSPAGLSTKSYRDTILSSLTSDAKHKIPIDGISKDFLTQV